MSVASSFRALSCAAIVAIAGVSVTTAHANERLVSTARIASVQPGTIVISARERALYFVLDAGRAIRYPIAFRRAARNGRVQRP